MRYIEKNEKVGHFVKFDRIEMSVVRQICWFKPFTLKDRK